MVEGDAFDLDATLPDDAPAEFDCAISGLPLLNFPMHKRVSFINGLLDRLPPGRRSCSSPMVRCRRSCASDRYVIERHDFIVRTFRPRKFGCSAAPVHEGDLSHPSEVAIDPAIAVPDGPCRNAGGRASRRWPVGPGLHPSGGS